MTSTTTMTLSTTDMTGISKRLEKLDSSYKKVF